MIYRIYGMIMNYIYIINQINQINLRNHSSDISYDIVKAHGGELKVENKEGEGVEFIIQLSTA